jgi:Na+-transporting NADH:ubiquinone oxidoreductase subunit B
MKLLLNQIEKAKPLFEPGGKLEKLYPLYEATDTFLFTPADVTEGAPHVRDARDMKRTMITVLFALMPCVLFGIWKAGHQYNVVNQIGGATLFDDLLKGSWLVVPIIMVSYGVGGAWETFFAVVRKHEINEGFLVTGMLFPLTLPPTIPLWQVAVGISFGVVIGKEVFGGTGFNVLNPALTARAFIFFSFPKAITGDEVWTSVVADGQVIQGFSGETPLAVVAQNPDSVNILNTLQAADYGEGFTWMRLFMGDFGGSIGESSGPACLIGAAILIVAGVGSWRIMTSCVIGLAAGAFLMNAVGASGGPGEFIAFTQLPFHYHLVMGGFLFGAVFMATDPVSGAATNKGKWIYGFMIGMLVVLIRVANPAYPEGVMLAILFMNVMAPLIDHLVLQAHIKSREHYLRRFEPHD